MDDERKDLNYIYVGCYDSSIQRRFENTRADRVDKMSPFVCMTNCQLKHRSNIFGITRGHMCMCEPLYNKWNHKYFFFTFERFKEKDTACYIDCFGNRGEKCGGISTCSIYRILADRNSSLVQTSSPTTEYAQGITTACTDDLNATSFPIQDGRTKQHGITSSILAGVSVGVALLVILLILLVLTLIRKRSKTNVSRTLQSSYTTDESVRYDNVPQSIQGSNSPYATLIVQNDCSTYDDLMPREVTYANTETVATNTDFKSQKKKRRKR
ncbi:uncharacterized protein LOC134725213 [Mytilus trossulus]|uniref:uncharacterized protein LOC134725213 n=1 Tax=Mytilus trossulus TaxID=6551 RepID=UPI003004D725